MLAARGCQGREGSTGYSSKESRLWERHFKTGKTGTVGELCKLCSSYHLGSESSKDLIVRRNGRCRLSSSLFRKFLESHFRTNFDKIDKSAKTGATDKSHNRERQLTKELIS